MIRDELVTIGDFFDFLEWRRRQGYASPQVQTVLSKQFLITVPPQNPGTPPALRFYRENGRLYLVQKRNELHRLASTKKTLSKISNRFFGSKKNISLSLYGYGPCPDPIVTIGIIKFRITVPEKKMVSVFENGYILESTAFRDGNGIIV